MAHDGKHKYGDSLPSRKRPRLQNPPLTQATNSLDLISQLPDECMFGIFSFLPSSRDRCSCAAVSKKWLVLQTKMRISDFKSNTPTLQPHHKRTSRCLEGKKANDIRLAAIAVGICPRGGLTELSIRGSFPSQGITDFGLKVIAQACPGLISLTVWDCLKVGNAGFQSIAQGCNSLAKLDVLNLPLIDDEGLIAIAKNCLSLSTLNLDSCPLISNASLHTFAGYSSKLESISLIKCPLLNDDGIISIISGLHKLATLKLASVTVREGALEAIGRNASSLRSLSLENLSGIREMGFCSMKRLDKVEFISTNACSRLSGTGFKAVGNRFVGLKVISIRNWRTLTDMGLKELAESAALLESLKLVECNHVTSVGLMEIFMSCSKRLKVLSLVKCKGIEDKNPSNPRRAHLPECPSLHSLTINRCVGVGDSFLSWLGSACAQVKHLELIGLTSITDGGVMSLLKGFEAQNKAMVSVDLSGCFRLTDWSVLAITSAFGQKLKSLRLDGCDGLSDKSLKLIGGHCPCLVELQLSMCRISDDGMFYLARSKHQCIEVLSLSGCMGITDKSLGFIEMMCGSLIGLNVKQCPGLTKRGIESLRETLWWCDLLY
ncbi:EIN3-binding F-box protein 2-like [Magnolia sinica]|uniref:EIN3-binding F-box protein 2-like n=1 Tax=Magnolia sinica TaxID=86752 RepID=UPI0026592B08|nr:EIN3-binding F-box protein 2-like [Magnolia sinica]